MKTGKYRTTSITPVRDLSRLVRQFKVLVGRSQRHFSHYGNSCWGTLGSKPSCDVYEKRGRLEWRLINPGYLIRMITTEP